MDSHTSWVVSVNIEVEPNNVLQTSPATLADDANTFTSKYPMARELTDNMAMNESPRMRDWLLAQRRQTAHTTVNGNTNNMGMTSFRIVATESAPNATWESPSPSREKRLRTSVTPRREEQRAIKTPTTSACCTKG